VKQAFGVAHARPLGSEQGAPGLIQLFRAEVAEIPDLRRDALNIR
jgi:hypothetical protein